MASNAVIVDAVRTPFGKRGGSFKDTHPQDLGAFPLRAIAERNHLKATDIEDVIYGNVTPVGEQGLNIARMASLAVPGWGDVVPGFQLNRMCGSGQQAVVLGHGMITAGLNRIVIAGGVEHMTRVPIGSDAGGAIDQSPISLSVAERFEIVNQGESAERIADKWGFSREDLDRFAVESQMRMAKAMSSGAYKSSIIPCEVTVDGQKKIVEVDEHPRPTTSFEGLQKLKPVFRPDGKVTAGNSSGIVDGAAAVLLADAETARARGWKPRARIVATHVSGVDPTLMLHGPIPSTKEVLRKANLTLRDIDLFECNEAFASVALAWMKETGAPHEKVNVNGGAIAHGHPLGATGAALVTKLVNELERTGGRYGLSTMCIGFGMGIATVIERI